MPAPATISISGAAQRVEFGQAVSFTGVVNDDADNPVADVRVTLQRRVAEGWARVGWANTDGQGMVVLSLAPVTENAIVRLRTQHLRSDSWRITMRPVLHLAYVPSPTSEDAVVITADAEGGQAGDQVQLFARHKDRWRIWGQDVLTEDGSVRFVVTPHRRQVTYAVVLARTDRHSAARAEIVVTKPTEDDQEPRSSSR